MIPNVSNLLSRNTTIRKTRVASKTRPFSSRSLGHLVVLIFSLTVFAAFPSSRAATPTSDTIGPAGPMVSWDSTAVGGASEGEDTCVEGVNCDTFTLNVSAGVWTGKVIAIKITWTVPADDYDLYVHFDANNDGMLDSTDPIVASSGDGAPETEEATTIDPSSTGVGRYFVHAVSFSVIPL